MKQFILHDNQEFKTYQEVNNYISELAESVEDVDLDNINVNTEKGYEVVNTKTLKEKNLLINKKLKFIKYK